MAHMEVVRATVVAVSYTHLDVYKRQVDDRRVHILLVVVPVSGALPELAVENDGSGYLHVACLLYTSRCV